METKKECGPRDEILFLATERTERGLRAAEEEKETVDTQTLHAGEKSESREPGLTETIKSGSKKWRKGS